MSRFSGRYYRGARRDDRMRRRVEAEDRAVDPRVPWQRRREARQGPAETRRLEANQ